MLKKAAKIAFVDCDEDELSLEEASEGDVILTVNGDAVFRLEAEDIPHLIKFLKTL